jgi:hypothetical protein
MIVVEQTSLHFLSASACYFLGTEILDRSVLRLGTIDDRSSAQDGHSVRLAENIVPDDRVIAYLHENFTSHGIQHPWLP